MIPGSPHRKRKTPQNAANAQKRVDERAEERAGLAKKLRRVLEIKFSPMEWQLETILEIKEGNDVIFVAGTVRPSSYASGITISLHRCSGR
jgi:hypothetical protein